MNLVMSTDRNGQPRGIINVTPFIDRKVGDTDNIKFSVLERVYGKKIKRHTVDDLEGVHKIVCKFMDEMITQQISDM